MQNGLTLPYNAGFGSMPNFPRWRVEEEEKCDTSIISMFGELVYYTRPLDIYPNPTIDLLNVKIPQDKILTQGCTLKMYDFQGQQILEKKVSSLDNEIQINMNKYSAGSYILDF